MLENLKAKNSDINVFSAFSEEYKEFGRIITVSDNMLNEIIDTAEKISVPDSVIYTPENKELENCKISQYIVNNVFGTLPTQIGYCCGHNSFLNATEWHTSSKINIAVTPLILILGHRWDILNGIIDSSKFKAFYLPKGTVTEVYATTLHYTPCQVSSDGFGCIVALPKGTNTALETTVSDKFMTAKNKWLIAHIDNTAKIKQGTFAGITGTNYEVKY